MNDNQFFVWQWLQDNCTVAGVIRCSNSKIADEFGWSQPYALKILRYLVKVGCLEELQKGTGHRPTKYRVLSSHNQSLSSHNQGETSQQVYSGNPFKTKPFRYINNPRNIPRDNAQTKAHIQNIFDNVAIRVRQPVQRDNTPFKRFRRHCDQVEEWKTSDFVCYFSLVHRVRFGKYPSLEWSKDLGAARTLLKRIGDPLALKAFIQIAFAICKKQPNGLYSFSFGSFYEDVINREIDDAILDEYDDELVFPWLKQELSRRGHEAAIEYQRNLNRVYLGF